MSEFLQKINNLEPARVRAGWAAIVALIVALGVTNSANIDGIGQAAIVAFFAIVPLVQGEVTRAVVTPQFKVDEAVKEADMVDEFDAQTLKSRHIADSPLGGRRWGKPSRKVKE